MFKHLKVEASYSQVARQWNSYKFGWTKGDALELAKKAVGVCQLPLGFAFIRLLRDAERHDPQPPALCIMLYSILEVCAAYERVDLFEYLGPGVKSKLEAARQELFVGPGPWEEGPQVTLQDLAGTPIVKKLTTEEIKAMGLPTS